MFTRNLLTPILWVIALIVVGNHPSPSYAGGTVVAWGDNEFGETNVPPDLTNVIGVVCGFNHSLALKSDGTIVAWGAGGPTNELDGGPYGVDNGQSIVPDGLSNVVAVAAGGFHSLALQSAGTAAAWGGIWIEMTPLPDLSNVVSITSLYLHNLALRADGTVIGWGDSFAGATNVPTDLTNAVAIASGYAFNLVLKADGTVTAWGFGMTNGLFGESGQATVPQGLSNVVAVACGGYHGMALKDDGTVISWGANDYGQTNVPPGLTNVIAIAGGAFSSIALTANGTVVVWGRNNYGQTNVPSGLTNVSAIASGVFFIAALVEDSPPALKSLLTQPTWDTNGFSVSLTTRNGRVYALEYKHSLADSNWTALPLVAGSGGIKVLTDPTAVSAQRFYRVRQW